MSNEVFTNVPTEVALQQAQIAATRALTDSVKSLDNRMADVSADLKDVRERVIAFEAAEFKNQLTEARHEFKEQMAEARSVAQAQEIRLRATENNVTKLLFALAVLGTIGAASLGVILSKLFGAH